MSAPERANSDSAEWAVNQRVRVYAGSADERTGTIVEDYGDSAGQAVDIGEHHIVDAAKRWAVALDDGALAFVDTDALTAE